MAENKNKKVTLKDVSKAAGLSLITVSRALRQPETVHEKTREKVQKTIEEIGYIPNLTARSLVSQRSDMIGVVVPILASSLFADFAQGISHILEPRKQQMLLAVSDWSPKKEEEAVRTFIARQADAIIVTGFSHTDATRKLLANFSGPVVEAWNLNKQVTDSVVGFDNYAAAVDMTRYLIDRGYEDIVMVGGHSEHNDQAADRTRGVMDTLRAAGRSVDESTVIEFENPATIDAGVNLMKNLMARKKRPDALFFLAELPAQGAMLWCQSNGVSVPDEVAIAGFGDLSMSSLLPVPLTTVQIRGRAIGLQSAQLVIDRLDGEVTEPAIHDIGYRLQIRQST
ncbi:MULTISPECIES: LacI family DNA-binding transcriptional regulator [Halocynthiibacter]|uniref:LacI family DNA-binding transcriptional regulator n=1 Tax=Halocynthiibacter halioticoli TaxID=2986804 RepID=A0AAE3IZ27_9RHOB|nr:MULTISPECIES: LacI family DNA-binding transcriptional regulator [Halocynthiibacter]MCV6824962.1 LacI family DNA-binding transcriptional regulator [Halocynthiibacter halioticoli]MCW4057963.1 LacI family DNA-binding transcriptional regulator [Halocynthiibacter sp. SDUM655004]MDE0589006.1 LacI family DNA-binding transcriptional regulator [Halocynthiibacter sp. C4]